MPKKKMVTRTFKGLKVTALCLDLETAEPQNVVVNLPRTYKNEKKLFQAVQDTIDTDTLKAVHVVDVENETALYGMPEEEFMKHAEKITRTKKGE